jgi:hypothetical protein
MLSHIWELVVVLIILVVVIGGVAGAMWLLGVAMGHGIAEEKRR